MRWFLTIVAALLCLVVVLALAINSGPGKRWIAAYLSETFSAHPRLDFQLTGLHGAIPSSIRLDLLEIRDAEGTVLVARDVSIRWSLSSVVWRPIHINAIVASDVEIVKPPPPNPDARPLDILRAIPNALRGVRVDALSISQVTLSDTVAGEQAVFRIDGKLTGRTIQDLVAELDVVRTDSPTTSVALDLDLGSRTGSLGLSARIEDSAFLPEAMGAEKGTPFVLALDGDGDSASWNGTLDGFLGGESFADASIELAVGDVIRASLDGTFYTARFPKAAPLRERLGDAIAIQGTGQRIADGAFEISNLRISGDGTEIGGQLAYDERAESVDLTVELTTESLARLLGSTQAGLDERAAATVSLSGSLETPLLETHLDLAETRLLEIDGNLNLAEGYGFDVNVAAWPPPPLLPAKAANALADGFTAHLVGLRRPDGSIQLAPSILRAAGAEVRFSADMDTEAQRLTGDVELSALDLARLPGLLPDGTAGIVSLQGRIDGTEAGWNATAEFTGTNVAFGGATTATLSGKATGSGESWKPSDLKGTKLGLEAAAASIAVNAWSQPELRLQVEAAFPESDQVQLQNLGLDSDGLSVIGRGDYNMASKNGGFAVDAHRLDLAMVEGLEGTAAAHAAIKTSAEVPLTATLEFRVADPGGLPEPALALITAQLDGAAEIALSTDSLLSFDAVKLRSEAMSATAKGALNLQDKSLEAESTFRVPDLNVLSASTGHSVGGAITGTATVRGPLDSMTTEFQVDADALAWDDVQVRRAVLNGGIANLPEAPSGDASLRVFRDDEELSAQAKFAVAQPRIDVPELTLRAGTNRVDGALEFNTETKHGEGTLSGRLDDLSEVGRLLDLDLAGQATLNVSLSGPPEAQRLQADVDATALQYDDLTAAAIHAKAGVVDPFGQPSGAVHAEGTDLHAGDVQLAAYSVDIDGDTKRAEMAVVIEDGMVRDSPLAAETRITASVADAWLTVDSLNATFAEHRIALTESARISRSEETAVIHVNRLTIDDGVLIINAERNGPTFTASITAESLPLSLIHAAGGPMLEGTAGGQFQFNGLLTNPVGTGSLEFRDVRERDAAYAPVLADVDIALESGTCDASFRLAMEDRITADASVALPVRFSLGPVDVGIDSRGSLRGSGRANADLSVIPLLLDMQDHVLRGRVNSELTLGGTASAPSITGTTRIEGARYENLRTGTILDNLRVVVEGKNRELQVTEFTATDGVGGTLAAKGRMDVAPQERFPFSLDGRMGNLRVANRDAVSGHADGTFAAAGNLDKVELTGAVTIGPATVNIPKRLPSEYPELDVTEINGPDDKTETDGKPAETPPPPIEIALDVACNMPGKVYVRSQSMDTEWKGNLHVGGTAGASQVTGTLSPVRGQIVFLDRTFNLQESAITLDGSTPPSPYLDLNAAARTADLTARLHLFGVYPDVKLELQSEPALPEDEILARLLFDRNLREITPFQAVQLAAMLESMRGSDGLSALSRSSRMLGDFRVQVRRQGEGIGETAVSVGKYLNDKVYVEVEQGLKDQSGQGKVEYQVTPELSIEGRADSEGKGGLGLFYKKDY